MAPTDAPLANEKQVYEDRARRSVFPFAQAMSSGGTFEYMGLQKRELFAAMAMQGTLASIEDADTWDPQGIASHAIACADALLSALQEVKP